MTKKRIVDIFDNYLSHSLIGFFVNFRT